MIDPFSAWSRMVSAGLDMQSTWFRSMETMHASHSVIDARTTMMRAATSEPLTGNYAELSRMMPEKIEAFGRSAEVVMKGAMAMHEAWAGQVQRVSQMMLRGRIPTLSEATTLATQNLEYALGAMSAGARLGKGALAPVHRTATRNARRLRRDART